MSAPDTSPSNLAAESRPGRDVHCAGCETTFQSEPARLFVKDGHSIVRCPSCGLVFRASLPTRDEVGGLYGLDYFVAAEGSLGHEGYLDYIADEDVHRLNARRRLVRLSRYVVAGPLLDVGCAAGFFVDEATRCGWSARGIDVSAQMVTWGVENLGADVHAGALADAPLRGGGESCITMWDYIEHALDPRGDVEQAYARLRPNGLLALSTGDAESVLARISLERWHLMTPRHHNYFFSAHTLSRLLTSAGFRVVYLGRPAARFPLRYLAHKAQLVADVPPVSALAERIGRSRAGAWSVPVSLRDVMTVVARRPP